jgi:hypothetical protein
MVVVFIAIAIGPGIYAIHRGIIIPLHHLLFCLVWRCDNNPVHWLGNKIEENKFGYKIAAYQKLRSELWEDPEKKKNLNVEHAENGMVVMTAGLFLAAAIYEAFEDQHGCMWVFFILASLFFFGAYLRAFFQHSMECIEMQKEEEKVKKILGPLIKNDPPNQRH